MVPFFLLFIISWYGNCLSKRIGNNDGYWSHLIQVIADGEFILGRIRENVNLPSFIGVGVDYSISN